MDQILLYRKAPFCHSVWFKGTLSGNYYDLFLLYGPSVLLHCVKDPNINENEVTGNLVMFSCKVDKSSV